MMEIEWEMCKNSDLAKQSDSGVLSFFLIDRFSFCEENTILSIDDES